MHAPLPHLAGASDGDLSILIIRFHALGDVAITLPACTALRRLYPGARIDFLTTASSAPLLESLELFDRIIIFPDSSTRWQRIASLRKVRLNLQGVQYHAVLDLQNNWVSGSLSRAIAPGNHAAFDRFSPLPAGERVYRTFLNAGFSSLPISYHLPVRSDLVDRAAERLLDEGWKRGVPLVLLNPAGLWESRNWPLPYYAEFARALSDLQECMFLFAGTDRISEKVRVLGPTIPGHCIDLVGRTNLSEVFPLLSHVSLVLSEDSGLMHMAWTSGVPTVALLGSSRHDWSVPLGAHTKVLHSGDLRCASCMEQTCPFGDTFCLARLSPFIVLDAARTLLGRQPASD